MLEQYTDKENSIGEDFFKKPDYSSTNGSRKIICRYGRGCTHYNDPVHKDQFWHSPIVYLDEEQKRSHYICNECSYSSPSLQELQLHLKRKTAWSNNSLVGCRISCLIDSKEWHEGIVTQYHRSGKHFVEFRIIGERRWLNVKKIAFYIVERPQSQSSYTSEYKDSEQSSEIGDGLAPMEDDWVYVDDVSLDYAFAQSALFKVYGTSIQETGHKTKGHVCLTEEDRKIGQQMKGSLLYGELLPRGVNKALGPKRLNAYEASTLFDLGMGTGKVVIQAFLQFRNLDFVYGIELSNGRYSVAESAAISMVEILGRELYRVNLNPGKFVEITELRENGRNRRERVLRMECNDMFSLDASVMNRADIVMLETDIPNHLQDNLSTLLTKMRDGAHALTYLDLRKICVHGTFQFRQLESNKSLSDRFPTSWSVQRGHHFFLWTKDSKDSKNMFMGSPTSTIFNDNNSEINDFEIKNHNKFKVASSSSNQQQVAATGRNPWGCLPFNIRNLFG